MSKILKDISGVVIYMDDTVVFGQTEEDHDLRLREDLGIIEKTKTW